MADASSFYITTPIFYVNDVPHIGHAYTEVAADVLARWHRQAGDDTWLLTGTDEHGQKILRTATANGVTPQEWADKLVAERVEAAARDDRHRERRLHPHHRRAARGQRPEVPAEALRRRPHLHGRVRGLLLRRLRGVQAAVRARARHRRVRGAARLRDPLASPVEVLHEKNYFFRMSAFADSSCSTLYEERPDFVQPESARNEVVSVREAGPRRPLDLALDFDWGIKVPWDESHVVYVWFDALLNYITAVGYGQRRRASSRAAGPPQHARRQGHPALPRRDLAGHADGGRARRCPRGSSATAGCWSAARRCRSRSSPASRPSRSPTTFGSDAFRYYFLSRDHVRPGRLVPWEDLSARYQAELANGFGNLASRVVAMVNRYCDGVVPQAAELSAADHEIAAIEQRATDAAWSAIEPARDPRGDRRDLGARRRAERLHHRSGAVDAREGPATSATRLETVLATAYHGLGTLAVLLSPVLPEGDREALDRARRRRHRAGAAHRPRERVGRSAARSRRSRRCSRASRSTA